MKNNLDIQAGRNANKNGNMLQRLVESILETKGIEAINYLKYLNTNHKKENALIKNVPYQNIAGARSYSEFVLKHEKLEHDARIECRWQQVRGTLDEKFRLLHDNMENCVPEKFVIILIDGGGARDCWLNWLKNACKKTVARKIVVMNLREFVEWVNLNL